MKVIKRSGEEVEYNEQNIINAISKANKEVMDEEKLSNDEILQIANNITEYVKSSTYILNIEDIQNLVEQNIYNVEGNKFAILKAYMIYRYKHQMLREQNTTDAAILSLVDGNNEEVLQENSNKNPIILPTQRDYIAGEVSKDMAKRYIIPEKIWKAHEEGLIHGHDFDYLIQHEHNCCLVNLKDMLENGTVISNTKIDTPHRFPTACNIATQIIAQVASSQFGGQTISLAHLAPYVESSRNKFRKMFKFLKDSISEETYNEIVEILTKTDIKAGVQTIQYQVNTLMTCNGQTPFISVYMDINEAETEQEKKDLALIIEEVLNQRIQGIKNEDGVWVTPAFPKLLYVLDENNIKEGTEYWYLTKLAAKCTAKRMVPDYISAKVMRELKEGNVFPCMGCRSFLQPYKDENGNYKFYGRFNQGVATVNLVDAALSSHGDFDKFWDILDERTEMCHEILKIRHERLEGTVSDVAPILWQHGGLARLKKGEKIDKLLHNDYSSISLGYAGLYECVKYMTGKSHTDPEARDFAMQVMQKLVDKANEWKAKENVGYSIYGTPIESTTYKFAKCLKKRFGIIEGITDRNYITNSYHVPVFEKIDAFSKLAFEAPFQHLSTGGSISYIEVPNLQKNLNAVLDVMQFMYENIMYAEMNTKSDYCQECGYSGEIEIVKNDYGKYIWRN